MAVVVLKNFAFNSEYFHSANVARVPRLDENRQPTEDSDVVLQLYLWVPESNGSNQLRQINIREDDETSTVRLYVHLVSHLSGREWNAEAKDALESSLLTELSISSARNSTPPSVKKSELDTSREP